MNFLKSFSELSFTREFRSYMKSKINVKLVSTVFGLIALTLVIVFGMQLRHLSTEYSLDQFFPKKHPLLTQSSKIRRTFQLQESPAFMVVLEKSANDKSSWLEDKSLKQLQKITENIQNIKGAQSTLSLGNLEVARNEKHELNIGPVYDRMPANERARFTRSNQLLKSQLISDDLKSVLVVIEPAKMSPSALNDFSNNIKRTIASISPDTKVSVGGVPAIQSRFSEKLFQELKLFMALCLVSFGLVFFLFFRGTSALALTFVNLIFSNLVIIGILCYFRISISVLLSTLPIIVCIASISLSIHTLHRWAEVVEEIPETAPLQERFFQAMKVLREMALANLLGSLTTAIGFIALLSTNIPLIREYAWVVASAVMGTWVLTHILLIGFMAHTRPVLRNWTKSKAYWSLHILRHSKTLLFGILAVTAVFVYFGTGVSFSGRLFDDLPKNESARHATMLIDQRFGGAISYDVVLSSTENDYWKNPLALKKLQASLSELRSWPAVGSALSVPEFLNGEIPVSQAGMAEMMFLFSMAEKNPLQNYLTEDGKKLRVSVRFRDLPSHLVENARRKIMRYLHLQFPGVVVQETGLAVTSHTINQEVSKGLVFGFWHSLVLIGILLMFVFKSLRWALIACLPNFIPPAILVGTLALVQTPVKPGVALIFSIALGLAFNNTVYLLSRLKRIMNEKKMTTLPLKRALLQEGNPCLFETMIMLFGFMIFMVSDFKINQTFGIYMVLSIVAGALGDLVFLPSLLKFLPGVLTKPLSIKKKLGSLASDQEPSDKVPARIAASLILFLIVLSATPTVKAAAPNEATQVLKKVQSQVDAKDDQATVTMKIIEANGDIKTRSLKLQTMRGAKKFFALARIQSPADIKGTAFLSEISSSQENQWLYLPSTKQVRRVVGGKKSAGVLGSELTPDDLNSTAVKGAQTQVVKKDADMIVISVTPKAGTSPYSKVLTSISAKDFVPMKTQYFQKDKVTKTVEFLNYKKG